MTTNSLNNQCLNDFSVTSATSGDTATLTVSNSSDTASSIARSVVSVSSSSTSDLFTRYAVSATNQYAVGIDNSDSDRFKISYAASGATPSSTNYFYSDTAGNIRKPTNCMFCAWSEAAQNNVTGDTTQYRIIFDNELFDIGNNYDASTGVFTAPISGKYLFISVVCFSGLRSDTFTTSEYKVDSSSATISSFHCGGTTISSASGFASYCSNVYVELAASDTVSTVAFASGGTKTVDISTAFEQSKFGGFLIG